MANELEDGIILTVGQKKRERVEKNEDNAGKESELS